MSVLSNASTDEQKRRELFSQNARTTPIPDNELWTNLGLFINRQALSRILYLHDLYKMILDVHGVVMEFGVRWGQSIALFQSFRGIYEPFNYSRKIIGFDTFSGFPKVDPKDGAQVTQGDYSVHENYEEYLEQLLKLHELDSPISHIPKFELVKGDVLETLDIYLKNNPETIIAMAYFDLDLYKPTKECLIKIQDRLTKGSIIAFDELCCHDLPGETIALKETYGLSRYPLKRSPFNPFCAYTVVS
jgi:hypothetical protein